MDEGEVVTGVVTRMEAEAVCRIREAGWGCEAEAVSGESAIEMEPESVLIERRS